MNSRPAVGTVHSRKASAPPANTGTDRSHARRRGWHWTKRIATWLFLGLVAWLLFTQARTIDWNAVFRALREMPAATLLAAGALAICSHALYSSYDLLGRRMTGHALGTRTVMGVTFISYAFNLSLGSFIGGGGTRFRLYTRLGLDINTITRVWAFSMLTNWVGYLLIGGIAFAFWPLALPPEWKIGSGGLRVLGAVLIALAAAYLLLCAIAREHTWRWRSHELQTPSLRMALLQMAMSSANWCLIGAVVWLLMPSAVSYPQVLAVLLVGAVAGVLFHVPGGLGVIEAVFVALLSHRAPPDALLASLLAYRGLYYLLPLMVAAIAYFAIEARARRGRHRTPPSIG